MPNAQEEFLKSLDSPQQDDPFATLNDPEATDGDGSDATATDPDPEDEREKGNRRERRLQAKLTAERESSIALAARLAALEDARKSREESDPAEYLKPIEKIFGTGTPEAAEATELLKTSLTGLEQRATARALEQFREEQQREAEEVAKEERTLDGMIEDIEDEIGSDLDPATRKGFFQMLEKLSPKDSEGNVIAYADHFAVWEELQARKQPQANRAKDLAARSMVRSGASPQTSVVDEATERYLRENGLI